MTKRANDKEKTEETMDFGPVYTQFEGKTKEAMIHLCAVKTKAVVPLGLELPLGSGDRNRPMNYCRPFRAWLVVASRHREERSDPEYTPHDIGSPLGCIALFYHRICILVIFP